MTAQTSPVDWSRVDTVLLDMDGTVLDLNFDNHFWRRHVPRRYARDRGLSVEQAWSELEPQFRDTHGSLDWYCLDHWSERLGFDVASEKQEIAHLIEYLPGAQQFLRDVRASGRRLWLVTNAHPDSLALKMRRTGLEACFDLLLSSHEFGLPKEDPAFWPALRERHPFEAGQALFVDDSPHVLRTARSYGIGQIIMIACPDTQGQRREAGEWIAVDGLADLASGIPAR